MPAYFINLDHAFSQALAALLPRTTPLIDLFQFFSLVGGSLVVWIFLLLFLVVFEEKRNKEFIAYFLGSILITGTLANYLFKWLFMRTRPFLALHLMAPSCPRDYSFPSGHAALSFACAVMLASFDSRRKWFYYTIAVVISYSRIFLYCHYISDVVAGALLGSGISLILLHFHKKGARKKKRS